MKSIYAIVELLESTYVPFSNIKLCAGTKLKGWYDGFCINIYDEQTHVLYDIPLLHVKHNVILGA